MSIKLAGHISGIAVASAAFFLFVQLTGRLVKPHSFLKRIIIIQIFSNIAHTEVNLTGAFL